MGGVIPATTEAAVSDLGIHSSASVFLVRASTKVQMSRPSQP